MNTKETGDNFITDEMIMNCIYVVRGQKVMIDVDLADLYQIDKIYFTREVIINVCHFPDDLIIELNDEDFRSLGEQNDEIKRLASDRNVRIAFTERAIPMLSCILDGDLVMKVNNRLIRIFYLIRQLMDQCGEYGAYH